MNNLKRTYRLEIMHHYNQDKIYKINDKKVTRLYYLEFLAFLLQNKYIKVCENTVLNYEKRYEQIKITYRAIGE